MPSPKKRLFYTEPGRHSIIFDDYVEKVKVTIIGGGGGGSSIGTAADGEDTVIRWFGHFVIAYGGKAGSIFSEYYSTNTENTLYRYSIKGKGGCYVGRDGQSKSLINFSPSSEKITILGGNGFNIGNGQIYGSGGDVNAVCEPLVKYNLAGGGSGGIAFTTCTVGSDRTILLTIGRGGKGKGFGSDGVNGAALIEY